MFDVPSDSLLLLVKSEEENRTGVSNITPVLQVVKCTPQRKCESDRGVNLTA